MHDLEPSPQPAVPWEPGDRWLRPWVPAGSRGTLPASPLPDRGLVPGRYTITYLPRIDEGVRGDVAGEGPVVVMAPAPAAAVGALWGSAIQGVMARDPDHLRALLAAAGRRSGTRWILLPWDGVALPGLWARTWARVTEWAPAAVGPVIVPVLPRNPHHRRDGRVSPDPLDPPDSPEPGDLLHERPDSRDPQELPGASGALAAALARARRELLRHLEEPVPAPVVLPAPAAAGFGVRERRDAGLEGVPVWWWLA